jgi:hypothetical protein
VTIPPYLLDLLRASMTGDWYGNLVLGVWVLLAAALVTFVVALAADR